MYKVQKFSWVKGNVNFLGYLTGTKGPGYGQSLTVIGQCNQAANSAGNKHFIIDQNVRRMNEGGGRKTSRCEVIIGLSCFILMRSDQAGQYHMAPDIFCFLTTFFTFSNSIPCSLLCNQTARTKRRLLPDEQEH